MKLLQWLYQTNHISHHLNPHFRPFLAPLAPHLFQVPPPNIPCNKDDGKTTWNKQIYKHLPPICKRNDLTRYGSCHSQGLGGQTVVCDPLDDHGWTEPCPCLCCRGEEPSCYMMEAANKIEQLCMKHLQPPPLPSPNMGTLYMYTSDETLRVFQTVQCRWFPIHQSKQLQSMTETWSKAE